MCTRALSLHASSYVLDRSPHELGANYKPTIKEKGLRLREGK